MQSLRIILLVILTAFMSVSCMDDDQAADYPAYAAFATVHASDATDAGYYFTLDDKKTVHPCDISKIGTFDFKERDGKRAIIYFRTLGQISGYDYNAVLYSIHNILTKEVETATTQEELEAFGDEGITVDKVRICGGWLNMYYYVQTPASDIPEHCFSLVDNRIAALPADMPPGFTYLEFHHNSDKNTTGPLSGEYISFKLGSYDPATIGAKGIYLKTTTPSGKPAYFKVALANAGE